MAKTILGYRLHLLLLTHVIYMYSMLFVKKTHLDLTTILLKICSQSRVSIVVYKKIPPNNLSCNVHASTWQKNTLICSVIFGRLFCPNLLESFIFRVHGMYWGGCTKTKGF